jgi:hypothetical protein
VNIKFLSLLTILLVFVSAISNADELLHERLQHFPSHEFKSGFDNEVMFNQVRSVFLQSKSNSLKPDDWDYLVLTLKIRKYRGKRLRFSAYVKTENVQEKA